MVFFSKKYLLSPTFALFYLEIYNIRKVLWKNFSLIFLFIAVCAALLISCAPTTVTEEGTKDASTVTYIVWEGGTTSIVSVTNTTISYVEPDSTSAVHAKNVVMYVGNAFQNIGVDLSNDNVKKYKTASATITLNGNTSGSAVMTIETIIKDNELNGKVTMDFKSYVSEGVTASGKIEFSEILTNGMIMKSFNDLSNDLAITTTGLTLNGTVFSVDKLSDLNQQFFTDLKNAAIKNLTYWNDSTGMDVFKSLTKIMENYAYGIVAEAIVSVSLNEPLGNGSVKIDVYVKKNGYNVKGSNVKFTFTNYGDNFTVDSSSGSIDLNGSLLIVVDDFSISSFADLAKILRNNIGSPVAVVYDDGSGTTTTTTVKIFEPLSSDVVIKASAILSGSLTCNFGTMKIGEVSLYDFNYGMLSSAKQISLNNTNSASVFTGLMFNDVMSFGLPMNGAIVINGKGYDVDDFVNLIVLDGIIFDQMKKNDPSITSVEDEKYKHFKFSFKTNIINNISYALYEKYRENIAQTSVSIAGKISGTATLNVTANTITFDNFSNNDMIFNGSATIRRYFYSADSVGFRGLGETLGDNGIVITGYMSGNVKITYNCDLNNYLNNSMFYSSEAFNSFINAIFGADDQNFVRQYLVKNEWDDYSITETLTEDTKTKLMNIFKSAGFYPFYNNDNAQTTLTVK